MLKSRLRRDFRPAWLVLAAVFLLIGYSTPAHAQYKIGPEDVLHIAVLGNKDLEMDVAVQPDGRISFPIAGEVQAAGMTVQQLSEELTRRVRGVVRNAEVGVTVREVNSYKLYLVGAVNRPGTYPVRTEITLLQLLSLGGGLTGGADPAQTYVVRGNEKIPVNVKKLLEEGDASQNPVLHAGDTVVIPSVPGAPVATEPGAPSPESQLIYIMGQVQRPGAILFAKDLNVLKALALAGGFTPFAAPSRVTVIREEDAKNVTLSVDVASILKGGEAKDVALKAGDVIHVPESLF